MQPPAHQPTHYIHPSIQFCFSCTVTDGTGSSTDTRQTVVVMAFVCNVCQLSILLSIASKYGHATTVRNLLDVASDSRTGKSVVDVLQCNGKGYLMPLMQAAQGVVDASRPVIIEILLNAKARTD